ncbi:HlyD family efflux transporter periplasmic adaptor subunit [Ramlibacter sp.]|uniref:HlyD family secretion protein n=1 Tax=Ramlibacter sp. TaxID=1917967 RepID=UPI0017E6357B|nr:HlyD family efflux transporter periplasmic adaptor subunit [Ramlibacter sp.]MBA2674417.1 HlyD family efflux transporter periplasmic adaptor subunit [Ramlibacter sp.]
MQRIFERLGSRKARVGVAVAAFIAGVAALLVYYNTRQITTQAFINAPVVTLRAPIPGRTALPAGMQIGRRIGKGDELGSIVADTENPRISELTGLIADLTAQRAARQSEVESINAQLAHRRREATGQRQRADFQLTADVKGAQASLAVTAAELERANAAMKESTRRVERADNLRASGFISPAAFDSAKSEEDQARAAQRAAKESMQRAEVVLAGAQKGLQIEGPRGLPYAVTRGQELDQSIADLTARKAQLEKQITAMNTEIEVLQRDLSKQSQAKLLSPVHGAVWSIDSNTGDAVARQGSVLQLVNCEDRWVEAFFSEKDAARIVPGMRVKIRSYYGGTSEWDGEVALMRYGTGRVTVGQYVVDPPPEVMRRQLPVRVATAQIRVNWGQGDAGAPLCNVGRSVEVLPGDDGGSGSKPRSTDKPAP